MEHVATVVKETIRGSKLVSTGVSWWQVAIITSVIICWFFSGSTGEMPASISVSHSSSHFHCFSLSLSLSLFLFILLFYSLYFFPFLFDKYWLVLRLFLWLHLEGDLQFRWNFSPHFLSFFLFLPVYPNAALSCFIRFTRNSNYSSIQQLGDWRIQISGGRRNISSEWHLSLQIRLKWKQYVIVIEPCTWA